MLRGARPGEAVAREACTPIEHTHARQHPGLATGRREVYQRDHPDTQISAQLGAPRDRLAAYSAHSVHCNRQTQLTSPHDPPTPGRPAPWRPGMLPREPHVCTPDLIRQEGLKMSAVPWRYVHHSVTVPLGALGSEPYDAKTLRRNQQQ